MGMYFILVCDTEILAWTKTKLDRYLTGIITMNMIVIINSTIPRSVINASATRVSLSNETRGLSSLVGLRRHHYTVTMYTPHVNLVIVGGSMYSHSNGGWMNIQPL